MHTKIYTFRFGSKTSGRGKQKYIKMTCQLDDTDLIQRREQISFRSIADVKVFKMCRLIMCLISLLALIKKLSTQNTSLRNPRESSTAVERLG